MGTRAIITKDDKEFIATHWDGYLEGLGTDLIGTKTDDEIIEAAQKHSIDFIHKSIINKVNKERYENISKKTNGKYSADDIAKMHKEGKHLNFTIMCADDYPIGIIDNYDDWAEYQYDFTEGKWGFRELHDCWKESNKNGEFTELTKENIKKYLDAQNEEDD